MITTISKIDIYGGLLGSGKTTLINKMLETAYKDYKVAIIENEIGKVNLDTAEFPDTSIKVKELTSGCVCCTLKGNFTHAIALLIHQEKPDYIVIEPTGLADLSGVIKACIDVPNVFLNRCIMVINSKKINRLLNVIGDFFTDQLKTADTFYLNFTENMCEDELMRVKENLLSVNSSAKLIDTPIAEIAKDTFEESPVSFYEAQGQTYDLIYSNDKVSDTIRRKAGNLVVQDIKDANPARIIAKNAKRIYTWSYSFHKKMSENDISMLKEILNSTEPCHIWRAKGYLKMENGMICKIDAVFGDIFEETRTEVKEDKIGLFVLIGDKLDRKWLDEQFKSLDAL